MFEAAELGRTIPAAEYKRRVPIVREALLLAQSKLREADLSVVLLISGVDGAGKGAVENSLNAWMDPRWMVTRAFGEPTQEERERPPYWRFWRALPARGQIALFLSAWYSKPLLDRAYGASAEELELALDEIIGFEKLLTDDKTAMLKIWLHLSKSEQEKRFKRLEKDKLQRWQVTKTDWKHWRMYESFVEAAERIIARSSTGAAPWHIVEGIDSHYASLQVADLLLDTIDSRLADAPADEFRSSRARACGSSDVEAASGRDVGWADREPTILSTLDMSRTLPKKAYQQQLALHQGRLHDLQRRALQAGISTVIIFEGWDASGKGGVIRRINAAVDSRAVKVIPVGIPTDEESAHHYLWRFWRRIPRAGRMAIFDRSWYGRVLVERVRGLASEQEWRRAYAEINLFEQQLVQYGIVLLKFFLYITPEEQLQRFRDRENTAYKRWKLTDEDWENRQQWSDYELAVHDVVERTSTHVAPWFLVAADDKRYARVTVLDRICQTLDKHIQGANSSENAPQRKHKDNNKGKGKGKGGDP